MLSFDTDGLPVSLLVIIFSASQHAIHYQQQPAESAEDQLRGEKATLGLYLTGHPIQTYWPELKQIITDRLRAVQNVCGQTVVIAGLVHHIRQKKSKRGTPMAFVTLDDASARMEIGLFGQQYENFQALLKPDSVLVASGNMVNDDFSGGVKLKLQSLWTLDEARDCFAKALQLQLTDQTLSESLIERLKAELQPHVGGPIPVQITYQQTAAQALLRLGPAWSVTLVKGLVDTLKRWLGDDQVNVIY